jgi:poly(3-hydroxybutyrate) depolymerase
LSNDSTRAGRRLTVGTWLLLVLAVAGAGDASAQWSRLTVAETGSYARLYLPPTLDASEPAPVVIFLHGSGARPENYEPFVMAAVEAAGCVMILPKSLLLEGWGSDEDEITIAASLRMAGELVELDPDRISIAGHSSGGTYAYLLAYTTESSYAAVFSMAAPFYPVAEIADRYYSAPIRMYYGTQDPNYVDDYPDLVAQWQRLGVAWEEDIQPGYLHNTWPDTSMEQGLLFLVSHSYSLPPRPTRRLSGWRRAESAR